MLTNENTNISLDLEIKYAKKFKQKFWGVIFLKNPKAPYIETRFGLHTFFVRFPLDIVILDKNSKAVKLKRIEPNKIFFWYPIYDRVLELPDGSINKLGIQLGHMLKFNLL